ncbi:hypothetical protein BH24ACT16_BH24ACT16_14080 [soil metagenome]
MSRWELSRRRFLELTGLGAGALAVGGCGAISPGNGNRNLPATPRSR